MKTVITTRFEYDKLGRIVKQVVTHEEVASDDSDASVRGCEHSAPVAK